MADSLYGGVDMAQLPVDLEVLSCDAIAGIAIDGRCAESQGRQRLSRSADECVLWGWFQRNIVAVGSAYFTEGRNIGADDAAMVKHGLDDGQTEAFNQRRRK
jgi:hypothetical protein